MNSYQVDRNKWNKLTVFEQMGNIGAEVGRTYSAHRRGDGAAFLAAFSRCLDLFDASALVWASRKNHARAREVLRARSEFAKVLVGGDEDPALERYFMQFALASRRQFA